MSDFNLLLFGCLVSFVAAGGAYLFLRERFTAQERPARVQTRRTEERESSLQNVA